MGAQFVKSAFSAELQQMRLFLHPIVHFPAPGGRTYQHQHHHRIPNE